MGSGRGGRYDPRPVTDPSDQTLPDANSVLDAKSLRDADTVAGVDAWKDPELLVAQQREVGRLRAEPWHPPKSLTVAGCFVAFRRGEQGPGEEGDRAFVGAALVGEGGGHRRGVVIEARAEGPYVPGLLALREGRMLVEALRALVESGRPDALMVDATGRDHPRRCGLAVHLGWALGLPSVGVTHRLLTERHQDPPLLARRRGDAVPIELHGEPVAAWVCTCDGTRPVVVHAGWRTDVATAIEIALRFAVGARTPEPLREARRLAREARSTG